MVDPRDDVPGDDPERAERPDRGDRGDRGDRSDRAAPERAATERAPTERPDLRGDRAAIDRGDLPESLRQRLEALVPEIVKKTFAAGMGAVFSTEEGIRRIAREVNIPDVAGYVASAADTTKDRVLEIVARETREFLQTMNFAEEIAKLLTMLSFEVKTEIRFIPNSEKYTGVKPDVKASARIKRADTKDGKDPRDARDVRDPGEPAGAGERKRRFWRRGEDDGDPGDGT